MPDDIVLSRGNSMLTPESLTQILREPTPDGLWRLRGDLLAAGLAPDAPALRVLNRAYYFFTELSVKASAREYSHFASMLDIAAVGVVVVSRFSETIEEEDRLLGALITAALSEGFMVMAARQYVKAWEEEMQAVYKKSAWDLYGEFWVLSSELQAGVPAAERKLLLDNLLKPVFDDQTSGTVRALIIGRLYQMLLLVYLYHAAL